MIQVRKALVVDSEFEEVPVLHDVEHVVSDLERELERGPKLLTVVNHLPIFEDLLLTAQVGADKLY